MWKLCKCGNEMNYVAKLRRNGLFWICPDLCSIQWQPGDCVNVVLDVIRNALASLLGRTSAWPSGSVLTNIIDLPVIVLPSISASSLLTRPYHPIFA